MFNVFRYSLKFNFIALYEQGLPDMHTDIVNTFKHKYLKYTFNINNILEAS